MMNDTQLPTLSGTVTHGQAIGRTYGMPTANLPIPADTSLPPCGVYASRVCWQGQTFAGLTHIGARPTVGRGEQVVIETHLLDFNQDLYGQTISVTLLKRLRGVEKFASLDALHAQIARDAQAARDCFAQAGLCADPNRL